MSFGKFNLVHDAAADPDTLYPKKITYEPTGVLSSLKLDKQSNNEAARQGNYLISKSLDMTRLTRLVRVTNQFALQKNLECLANQLAQIVVGNSHDSGQLRGKTMRINMRIGWLNVHGCGLPTAKIQF